MSKPILYSAETSFYSQLPRLALTEKKVDFTLCDMDVGNKNE